tara:strand:- start:77894 stop:78382 length:489 start_codon:yes stop_codon:yes gene_type:complete
MNYVKTFESYNNTRHNQLVNENKLTKWIDGNLNTLTEFLDKSEVELKEKLKDVDIKENSEEIKVKLSKIYDKIEEKVNDPNVLKWINRTFNTGIVGTIIATIYNLFLGGSIFNVPMLIKVTIFLWVLKYVINFMLNDEITLGGESTKLIKGFVKFVRSFLPF